MNAVSVKLATVGCSVVAFLLLASLSSRLHGQEQPSGIADLESVENILRDPGATLLQKHALVGKEFSGVVSVDAAQASAALAQRIYSGVVIFPGSIVGEAAVLIDVDLGRQVSGNRTLAFIKMRFAVHADVNDQASLDRATLALLRLRKGQRIRLRGTLKDFTVTQSTDKGGKPTNWANFSHAVVEGIDR
jgi:hypothetical protein